MNGVKTGQLIASIRKHKSMTQQDMAEKSSEISIQVLKKEKRTRKVLAVVCTAAMLIITSILSIWGPIIFQRGNPLPYLIAVTKISDVQPYVQVGNKEGVFISKRGECPELFEYVEANKNVKFAVQAGSGYIFSNGVAHLIVGSEIYWGNYTVWIVPHHTLEAP